MSTTTSTTEKKSQSAPEQAKDKAREVAQEAKGQTREQLRTQLAQRSTQLGEQTATASIAMRRASSQLREDGNERAAGVVDAVADRGQRLGEYLRDADGDQLLRDVEDFARTRPWLMVGGSALLGFLGSRFMKASSHGRYQTAQQQSGGHLSTAGSSAYPARALPSASARQLEDPADAYPSGREEGLGGRGNELD
jgi:ElaB/YqjD/DUF883 family membrane-anchored ribosome-binding protein